jgi:hypothetical protein
MRLGSDMTALRKIVEVRFVQRRAAEIEVVRAAAHLARTRVHRDVSKENLNLDQRCWSQTVSEPSMSVHLALTWSAAILAGEATLRRMEEKVVSADAEKSRRGGDWCAAQARLQAAQDLANSASKKVRRLREETALNHLADRLLQRRVNS